MGALLVPDEILMADRKRGRFDSLPQRFATLDTSIGTAPSKESAPYYRSAEHQAWRALVIRRARARCEWPGCGRAAGRMFADHIVELRDGGSAADPANGQCLCGAHHTLKTNQERAKRMAQKF